MKKLLVLVLGIVMLFSMAALATPTETVLTDGELIDRLADVTVDKDYASINGPRNFYLGEPSGPQTVSIKLPIDAVVPCHLEMQLTGNDLDVKVENWGPNMNTAFTPDNIYMVFHPDLCGYMNDWTRVAGSDNNSFEIEPGPGVFIRACDTFKTSLWSNMNYKYSVKSAGLKGGVLNQELPIGMRAAVLGADKAFTALVAADWSVNHSFLPATAEAVLVNGGNATQSTFVYQQFRIPFDKIYAGGKYTGNVEFWAGTL